MAIIINDNIEVSAGKPIDNKYLNSSNLPYSTTSEVLTGISISERYVGLTVNVNYDEYWFATGVTNSDLIVKNVVSGTTISNVQNVGGGVGVFSGITSNGTISLRSLIGSGDTQVSLSGNSIIIRSTGGTSLNDGILEFNNALSTFEPYDNITTGLGFYTGNTVPTGYTNLNLNGVLTLSQLNFSTGTTTTSHIIGDLYWDNDDDTLSLKQTEEVTQQIGEEILLKVKNNTGGAILNGNVVYITGSDSGRPTVELARASNVDGNIITKIVGVATEDISATNSGFVTIIGLVRDLNTTGFTEGDTIYLSPISFGGITNVKPTYPDYVIEIGVVTNIDAINGRILVKINNVSQQQPIRSIEVVNPPFTATTRSDTLSVINSGTLYLPSSPLTGQEITIFDRNGNGLSSDIIIDGNGNNINDDTQAIINTNYGSFTMIYDGTKWNITIIKS